MDKKSKYIDFINSLVDLAPSKKDKLENVIKSINDEEDVNKILTKYVSDIDISDKNRKMLLNRNSKLFHNSSKSTQHITLIPSLNLKKLLDSGDDELKNLVWHYAQLFYTEYSSNNFVEEIKAVLTPLKINMDNVVKDIANTFKEVNKDGGNPLSGTFKTIQLLSEKYGDKLTPENCSVNDVFNSVKKVLNIGDNMLPPNFNPNDLFGKVLGMMLKLKI